MPFIKRNNDGTIHSISQHRDDEYTEYLPTTAPDILNFLHGKQESKLSKDVLLESDRDIPRITEDLIYLLISKNIILFTELPDAVQHKLLSREKLRSTARSIMKNFLDDGDTI